MPEAENPGPKCQESSGDQPRCTIELLLPGHRGPYALNDFRQINDRTSEKAIVDYLFRAASQIGSTGRLELIFRLPEEAPRDRAAERTTERAYRDMLVEWTRDAASASLLEVPKALILASIGTVILLISHFIEHEGGTGTLLGATAGVFQVGAWVSLWTAFSALFFQATSSWRRSAILRKVAKAPIRFHYADVAPNEHFEQPPTGLAPAAAGE